MKKAKVGPSSAEKSPSSNKSAVGYHSVRTKNLKSKGSPYISLKKSPQPTQKNNSYVFSKVLSTSENEYVSDECAQIANEMIYIVYEKIEKTKAQIKAQNEIKRKLELELVKQEEHVKDNKELIRKLERDESRLNFECDQLENDCLKLDGALEEINQSLNKSEYDYINIIKELQEEIENCKIRVEREKIELVEQQDKEIPIESELALQKAKLEQKIKTEDKLLADLEKQVRMARIKEDLRVKKFKSTTKTLDVALTIPKSTLY